MVNARATNNKKRSATTKIQGKPSKNLKKADPVEEISQNQDEESENEGLFDNLDEEMDPSAMDSIINQLEGGESQSEEEEEEEEVVSEEEEEEEVQEDDNMEEEEEAPSSLEQQSTAKRFRDSYMTKVTQAFGSDLDIIRQEPNLSGPRLNILINSLEAGIDIFSTLEQEIILADEEK
ncbi:unnamed protein product [Mucor hiemalis]